MEPNQGKEETPREAGQKLEKPVNSPDTPGDGRTPADDTPSED